MASRPRAALRIVIADDQTVVREGLQMVLDVMPDLEVVATVADGEQALAAVAEHRPDAILLDLHMPVLDGVGATERLTREHPGGRDRRAHHLRRRRDDHRRAAGREPAAT